MSLEPGARIGPYAITAPLGAGGMGEVYRAQDPRLNRDVAIKVLPAAVANDPDRVARFTREAQSLAALNHPHIAQLYGIEESGSTRAIVMELVEGETLADRIARGPIPLDEALLIARQVAEALEAAHDAGIIHRDLKPANVKVRGDGSVKVLDFGLAKAMEAPTSGSSAPGARSLNPLANSPTVTAPALTMQGVLLGTAAYMAPEQARGKPVDQRADIWAFGCVLYEMLTGRPVFSGDDVTDLMTSVLRDEPDWSALPETTSEPLRRLLRRTLTKDPRRRLQSAADVRLEIEDAIATPAEAPSASQSRRPLWHLVAAAAIGAAIVAASLLLANRWLSPPVPAVANGRLSLSMWLSDPGGVVNELAISPDGRYLVTGGVGDSGIWIHPLDGGPARHLDAPPNGVCWSPDSRTLLYPRPDGRLVKLEPATGAAVLFVEPPTGARGHCTWSSNGVVLFASSGGFHQIPASGGAWTRVAVEDGEGENMTRSAPCFLPDGRHFLYALAGQRSRAIRVASLDDPKTALVLDDAESDVAYVDGHLLFQRGADLVAQPFDTLSLSLAGEPRPVATGTHHGTLGPTASFTVSRTGVLVHAVPKLGRQGRLEWFDRRGQSLGVIAQPDETEYLNPALSPDLRTLAVNRMDPATGNWDIWLVDLSSGRETRLTTHPDSDSDPVWSPDGRHLAYRSVRPEHVGIYRIDVADRREEPLLQCKVECGRMILSDWTRDGRFILYLSAPFVTSIVPATPGGDGLAETITVPGSGAALSPDGKWVAYASQESGTQHVYVQPFPGPGPRTLVSTVTGGFPTWRADGKELFYSGRAQGIPFTVLSVDVSVDRDGIRTSAPRPAVPGIELMSLVDSRPHFDVTPDGQRILMRQPDGPARPPLRVIVNWRDRR